MTKFTQSGKHNPCPVCGRTKDADCRITEAGNLILCHSYLEDTHEGRSAGYKFLSQSKDGLWGTWVYHQPDEKGKVSGKKPIRTGARRQPFYYADRAGHPLIMVVRKVTDGKKTFAQYKWDGVEYKPGINDFARRNVPIYRYAEVQQAIQQGKTIFIVEGEGKADRLWELGIPATTTIGGSKGYRAYGNYHEDLKGATLVLCPDRDKAGLGYMEEVAKDFPETRWCYPFPDSPVWAYLPDNNGLDVADWIDEGATIEDIVNAIGSKKDFSKPEKRKSTISSDDLQKAIDRLILEDLPQSQLEAFLPELAKQSDRTAQDIWRLYRSRVVELEQHESRGDRAIELSHLLKIGSTELSLSEFLHPILAEPLQKVAELMGSNGAAMLTTLLPIAATLLRVGTRLELIASTNFYALPILYTGILAESGSAKSPTQKTLLNPLFRLQMEADDDYNARLEDYEEAKERAKQDKDEPIPPKPKNREYYTCDSTREAIVLVQSQQPDRGFLGWFDELSGLINGQNQYRNGRGTDRESILSGRDGTGLKVNRASGKRLNTSHSAYSITGSTQPDTLRKLIGDFSDPTGQWARFLWATLPIKPAPFPDDAPTYKIDDLLYGIYRRLEDFAPTTYTLSTEARAAYAEWFNKLDHKRMIEPQQGLRAVYAKMKADTGVLALLLHCLNAAINCEDSPADKICLQTMQTAIRLSQYYLGQVRLIHAEGESADSLQDHCQRLIKISQRKGWINARDAYTFDRSIRKHLATEQIRSLFRELVEMGIGELSGERRSLEWRYLPPKDKTADKSANTPAPSADSPIPSADSPPNLSISSASACLQNLSANGQTPAATGISTNGHLSADRLQNCLQNLSANGSADTPTAQPPQLQTPPQPSADKTADSLQTPPQSRKPSAGQGFGLQAPQSADKVDNYKIKQGSRVRYRGTDRLLTVVCNEKVLTVEVIKDRIAVCSYQEWYITREIPIADLRRADS